MKIFQTSDLHLGRHRLNGRLPDNDMVNAFNYIADEAIAAKADILLLVGDIFDKPQVEPNHLRQAQDVLYKLKRSKIPVIAVEGNHDKTSLYINTNTWIKYLSEDDLLILLQTTFNSDGPNLIPWNSTTKIGSYIDLDGIRFVGAGYLGAATPYKSKAIAAKLSLNIPNVLLLHAGPNYFVGEGGGFHMQDLDEIRKKVCYIALGHIHKPMKYQNWACNAGSPENCELREAYYDTDQLGYRIQRGYAIVEINNISLTTTVNVEICSNPRRPIHNISLDCTPFGNKTKYGQKTLIESAIKLINNINPSSDAVVNIKLKGNINLKRIAVDQNELAYDIEKYVNVAAIVIDNSDINMMTSGLVNNHKDYYSDRSELEKSIMLQILNDHNLFDLHDKSLDFVHLFHELKEGIKNYWDIEKLSDHLVQSYLVQELTKLGNKE